MIRASRESHASYGFAARGGRDQLPRHKILSRLIFERVHKYSYDISTRLLRTARLVLTCARGKRWKQREESGRAISGSSREDEPIVPFGEILIRTAKLALNAQRKCIYVCTENVPSQALQARARDSTSVKFKGRHGVALALAL